MAYLAHRFPTSGLCDISTTAFIGGHYTYKLNTRRNWRKTSQAQNHVYVQVYQSTLKFIPNPYYTVKGSNKHALIVSTLRSCALLTLQPCRSLLLTVHLWNVAQVEVSNVSPSYFVNILIYLAISTSLQSLMKLIEKAW